MYSIDKQNTKLNLGNLLNECNYTESNKDYIINMVMQILDFPKKVIKPKFFKQNQNEDQIIMVWYVMSIPFREKNYNVPLNIFIGKKVPYEPPQIVIEYIKGYAINPNNRDIIPNTGTIMTKTLKNWNQYSNIETVLNEIFYSFSTVFPIYKPQSQSQQNNLNQPLSNSMNNYNNNFPNFQGGNAFNQSMNNSMMNNSNMQRYNGPNDYYSIYKPNYNNNMNMNINNNFGRSLTYNDRNSEFINRANNFNNNVNFENNYQNNNNNSSLNNITSNNETQLGNSIEKENNKEEDKKIKEEEKLENEDIKKDKDEKEEKEEKKQKEDNNIKNSDNEEINEMKSKIDSLEKKLKSEEILNESLLIKISEERKLRETHEKTIQDKQQLIDKYEKKIKELEDEISKLIEDKNSQKKEELPNQKNDGLFNFSFNLNNNNLEDFKSLFKDLNYELDEEKEKEGKNEKHFAVNFISIDQRIHYPVSCTSDSLISRLEEELYNEYPEYKEYFTYLTVNGHLVKRFKTIEENKIKKGDAILVNIYEP